MVAPRRLDRVSHRALPQALPFFLDLWENLPRPIRLRGVRADAGFSLPELRALWEQLHLPYVVVAQLSQPRTGRTLGAWCASSFDAGDCRMKIQRLTHCCQIRNVFI